MYCLISTSYLAGLFGIFILLHISQNCVCFGDILPMRTFFDAYHKEFESHYRSILSISEFNDRTPKRTQLLVLSLATTPKRLFKKKLHHRI